MAREVESVHTWTEEPRFGIKKGRMVIRCTDGAVYEWEQAADSPHARFVRGFQPDGSMSHLSGAVRLPSAVENVAERIVGAYVKNR